MNDIPVQVIRAVVSQHPGVVPLLSEEARGLLRYYKSSLKAADLSDINATYHDVIIESLIAYFEGGSVGASRQDFKQATIQAFSDAFDAGWVDAGAELPVDDEALDWIEARITEEFGYIEELFEEAKELRRDKEFDWFSWATARADGYTRTLTELHNQAQVMVRDNVMVTFRLGSTEKHCRSCLKLNGQRHKLSWFVSHGYLPPYGENLECSAGGHCDCTLETDKGEIITA